MSRKNQGFHVVLSLSTTRFIFLFFVCVLLLWLSVPRAFPKLLNFLTIKVSQWISSSQPMIITLQTLWGFGPQCVCSVFRALAHKLQFREFSKAICAFEFSENSNCIVACIEVSVWNFKRPAKSNRKLLIFTVKLICPCYIN